MSLTHSLADWLALIHLILAHFRQTLAAGNADAAVADELRRVLALLDPLPPQTGEFAGAPFPAARFLAPILEQAAFAEKQDGTGGQDRSRTDRNAQATLPANADLKPILAALRPLAPFLPWRYNYDERPDAPGLGQSVSWAELVGPQAPLRSDRVCLGFTFIGPHTLYPAHRHPAAELYHVLSGTAEWTTWEGATALPTRQPPGAFILHPSNIVHAMRTDAEPLLAIYTWSGADVVTLSAYVG